MLSALLLRETFAAIDGSSLARFEWQFGRLAALGACRCEGLAGRPHAGAALRLPDLTAGRAAFGLVSVALLGEELLLLGAEGEVDAAVDALDGFVRVRHRITSSLHIGWPEFGLSGAIGEGCMETQNMHQSHSIIAQANTVGNGLAY